jgi:hypothetical protein
MEFDHGQRARSPRPRRLAFTAGSAAAGSPAFIPPQRAQAPGGSPRAALQRRRLSAGLSRSSAMFAYVLTPCRTPRARLMERLSNCRLKSLTAGPWRRNCRRCSIRGRSPVPPRRPRRPRSPTARPADVEHNRHGGVRPFSQCGVAQVALALSSARWSPCRALGPRVLAVSVPFGEALLEAFSRPWPSRP